ncbi:MAG: hypothetical protein HY718_11190 [Planctomycetes bacterium]|nr:hypothetical protein [Planctomycetota bacterium]
MRTRTGIVAVGVLAAWPAMSAGAVVVSLNNPGSTTLHEVEVVPGGTFSVDVNVTVDQVSGVGWLQFALRASTSGVFDVSDLTANAPWIRYGTGIVGGMDDTSSYGGLLYLGDPPRFGPGSATVASVRIAVDPVSSLGTYTIDAVGITWAGSPVIPEHWPGQPGPSFIVRVLPEPATLLLLLPGVLLVRRLH